jgi:hypothetical protein
MIITGLFWLAWASQTALGNHFPQVFPEAKREMSRLITQDSERSDQSPRVSIRTQSPGRNANLQAEFDSSAPEIRQNESVLAQVNTSVDFDADAAFEFLRQVAEMGPRVSASEVMRRQIRFLIDHFQNLNAQVYEQHFDALDPSSGRIVKLTNLVVRWHPDRKKRLLFCCHYDTRPFPDRDNVDPRGLFLGVNDGGSAVAVLCELGKFMNDLDGKYGIDFVFFDGEEFVYLANRDPMFLGSTFFAQQYINRTQKWKYDFGILLDMVGDADLQLYMEGNSLKYTPRLVRSIWSVAKDLGINEFIPEKKHLIRDDHLPLNEIGKIPTCNIIDFDYPNPQVGNVYWHTRNDLLENCSAESLGKVGRVVLAWTRQMQDLNRLK